MYLLSGDHSDETEKLDMCFRVATLDCASLSHKTLIDMYDVFFYLEPCSDLLVRYYGILAGALWNEDITVGDILPLLNMNQVVSDSLIL
jgi:hypothetical protein